MAQTITYSELVSIIVKQLNKFRDDPMFMLPVLEKRIEHYNGNTYMLNKNVTIQTQQGVTPVRQVATILNSTNRLPKLNWSFQLHCVANKRAKMLARSQTLPIVDNANGMTSLEELLASQVECSSEISQHFLFGHYHPLDIVAELLIDDGNPQRQNRMQLLKPLNNYVGIGIEQHPKYKFIVVIIFATSIEPKKVPNFNRFNENQVKDTQQTNLNMSIGYDTNSFAIQNQELPKQSSCKSCIIF